METHCKYCPPFFATSLICVFLFLFASQVQAGVNLTKLVQKIQPAVVTVITYDQNKNLLGQGSGFFIDKKGHLITNYHVLKGAYSAEVKTFDGKKYPIELIIADNETMDLIKLFVAIPGEAIKWVKATKDLPYVAERVLVIGSPMGLERTVSEGIVSAIREIPRVGQVLQISAPISPGSSGSPITNMKGEVIGVASFYLLKGQNLNFAVPGKYLFDLKDVGKTISNWTWEISQKSVIKLKPQKGRLFVDTEPKGARIRILNIKPKFYQGIELESGKYHIEVSTDGYQTKKLWVRLGAEEDKTIRICLKQSVNRLSADDWFQKGLVLENINEYRQAIELYNKAIKLKPKEVKYYVHRSDTYHSLATEQVLNKKYDKAIETLRYSINDISTTIEITKNMPHMDMILELGLFSRAIRYNDLAKLYKESDKADKFSNAIRCNAHAKIDSSKAIKLAISNGITPSTKAYFALGAAHVGLIEFKEGIRALNRAILIDNENMEAAIMLNDTYNKYISKGDLNADMLIYPTISSEMLYSKGEYSKAIAQSNEAIAIDEEDVLAYYYRGVSYIGLNNYQQGIEDLNTVLQLYPKYAEAYYSLGRIYYLLGNVEQAIIECDKCISLNPPALLKAFTLFYRGDSNLRIGNYHQAITDFNNGINLNPNAGILYRGRGFVYRRLGDHQQSIKDMRTAAKLGDNKAQDFLRDSGIDW